MKRPFIFVIFLLITWQVFTQNGDGDKLRKEREQIENERRPNVKKLYELIRSSDRLSVTYGSDGEQKILYESADRRDIDALHAALKLVIPKGWWLSVCADPTITLYKDGKVIAYIGDVSGREVKTSVWGANALIADQEKWLRWFDERGMPQVRKERDHAVAMEKQDAQDKARWYKAMPRGAKKPFEKQLELFGLPSQSNTKLMKDALEREYPEKGARIRAVLRWYGSGAGPWSGYPSYEGVVGDFLFEFSTREILDALDFKRLSFEHLEGAARHFASWDFGQKRPEDLKLIPDATKQRLLEHSLRSSDEDKRDRAKKAFGESP